MSDTVHANLFEFESAEDFLNGRILLIDKPLEWTSFDVVNKVRGLIRQNGGIKKIKVGHAGTLDPLATGVLVLCTGQLTKQIEGFLADDKHYDGTMRLGAVTVSQDREQPEQEVLPMDSAVMQALEHAGDGFFEELLGEFRGSISQVPPSFSAKKVNGRRAYKSARKGELIAVPPAEVTVSRFEVSGLRSGTVDGGAPGMLLDFEVDCSKGTYIRALARDLGAAAGCGAYLSKLRRTRSGNFSLSQCWQLDDLAARIERITPLPEGHERAKTQAR